MPIKGQAITVQYVAWDTQANSGKTGDVANHTLRWVKDGVSAPPSNAAAEVDVTNAPGVYKVALTSDECNAWLGTLCGKSATANVSIIPISITFVTAAQTEPDNAGITDIKTQTDKLSFTSTDLIATLDGEKVTVATNEDKTGYSGTATNMVSLTGLALEASVQDVLTAIADIPTDLVDLTPLQLALTQLQFSVAKVKAAVYDSATMNGQVVTLSDGHTQTFSQTGRTTSA